MLHPLLVKIDIFNIDIIDKACEEISKLGLLVKKHDNLIMVKYPDNLRHSELDYIKYSRGLIIDFNKKRVVNTSIPGSDSLEVFLKKIPNFNDIVVEKCLDGTLINLYFYNNKWNVATKFCINADESKFRSNKSYRQLLDEIIDLNTLSLDTSYSYSFLLRHKDCRNVTPVKRNRLIHLESTNTTTGEKVKINLGLKTPLLLKFRDSINVHNFQSIEDITNNLKDKTWKTPGYMLYSSDRKYRTRLENPNYNKVYDLVKGQTSVNFILLREICRENVQTLLKYYPEWYEKASFVNKELNKYIDGVYGTYVNYKIKNTIKNIDNRYKKPVFNLHGLYIEKKKLNPVFVISYSDVCKLIREYDIPYLYSILFK